MKILAAIACLLFAASLTQAQTPPPATAPTTKAPATKAPVAKAAPAKPGDKKKEEPLPKIPGQEILRSNGTYLGLEVVNGNFKLSFYDKKKKPMAVDVTRGNARWPNIRTGTPSDYRTVLNPSGNALVGARPVLPPFVFNVYLNLLQGEGEDAKAVETYVVPFRG